MNLMYWFHLFFCLYSFNDSHGKSISFINPERPVIDYYDPKAIKNITLISHRISRQDPRHYVELHLRTFIEVNKNYEIVFYFYEFLTNRYSPSFIQMHFQICDMIKSDNFFGATIKNALNNRTCPIPPGEYSLLNMKLPFVPQGFPFTKGRIYANATETIGKAVKLIVSGHADIEIKTFKIK